MDEKRKALLDSLQAYRVSYRQAAHKEDKKCMNKLRAIIDKLSEQLGNLA